MTEKNEVKQEVGVVDIVNSIADKQRATAIDAIQDMLFAKSNDAMDQKHVTFAKKVIPAK